MLKKETIDKICQLLKIKTSDFNAAIKSEDEKDIEISESITVFTEEEVTALKNNEYKAGKTKGVPMAVDEAKEKYGIEYTGKTLDGLIEAAQKKAISEAKLEPGKQVTDLQEKVTTLQKAVSDYEKVISEKDNEVSSVKINGELMKNIPAGTKLEPDEVIGLMRIKGYDFKMEEGKLITYKDGKVVQDKVANPLGVNDVIKSFVVERKLGVEEAPQPGGRGGGDGKPVTNFTSLTELKKSFQEQQKSMLGSEFAEAVTKAVKEYPEFAMDK